MSTTRMQTQPSHAWHSSSSAERLSQPTTSQQLLMLRAREEGTPDNHNGYNDLKPHRTSGNQPWSATLCIGLRWIIGGIGFGNAQRPWMDGQMGEWATSMR